jgi:hypothetical protein
MLGIHRLTYHHVGVHPDEHKQLRWRNVEREITDMQHNVAVENWPRARKRAASSGHTPALSFLGLWLLGFFC